MIKLLRYFLMLLLILTSLRLDAQKQDARSKSILSGMAAKYTSYSSFSAEIETILTQPGDTKTQNFTGRVLYKGEKYRISLPDMDIFCDGKKIYQYLPQVKEVNVSLVTAGSKGYNVLVSSPMAFFKVYEKEFVSSFVQEVKVGGKTFTDIDMFPVALKSSDITRIRLRQNKQQNQIHSMTAFLKNGFQYYIEFDQIVVNQSILDREFVFNPIDHPGVDVIDLSF